MDQREGWVRKDEWVKVDGTEIRVVLVNWALQETVEKWDHRDLKDKLDLPALLELLGLLVALGRMERKASLDLLGLEAVQVHLDPKGQLEQKELKEK